MDHTMEPRTFEPRAFEHSGHPAAALSTSTWRTARPLWIAALLCMVAITAGHYTTGAHSVVVHNLFRRLYYLPVVLFAFAFGLRGGLAAAVATCLAYAPHAFWMSAHHRDPAPSADKAFEMALYLVVGGLTGLLVDRQRRVQARLEHALSERDALSAELVRAGKLSALGEMVAGVAHEVRNPLASILAAAEGLQSVVGPAHPRRKLVDLQLTEIDRLSKVVTRFLAFAKPTAPGRAWVDLEERATAAAALLGPHQSAVTFDPSLKDATVRADPDQLLQILLNLALNAVQAMTDAGRSPRVRMLAEMRSIAGTPHLCIGVRDFGPGIPAAAVEQVFDPFFSTKSSGTGLGLSVSSRLMEAHGGFLQHTRDDDAGHTTFWACFVAEEAP